MEKIKAKWKIILICLLSIVFLSCFSVYGLYKKDNYDVDLNTNDLEAKNFMEEDLITKLKTSMELINSAQKSGEWTIDILDSFNSTLILINKELDIKNDLGDLLDGFREYDTMIYSLSCDYMDKEGSSVYYDKYKEILANVNNVRTSLGIDENSEYKRERSLNALMFQNSILYNKDSSKVTKDDFLSLAKNIEIIKTESKGNLSTEELDVLVEVKAVLDKHTSSPDSVFASVVTDSIKDAVANCEGYPNLAILTGDMSASSPVNSNGNDISDVFVKPNKWGIKPLETRTYTLPKDYKVAVGVKTYYGRHTYGCKTQEEYDEVIRILQEEVLAKPHYDEEFERGLARFIKGDRLSDYDKYSQDEITDDLSLLNEYGELVAFEGNYATLLEQLDTDFFNKLMSDYKLYYEKYQLLCQEATSGQNGEPNSAYDTLVRKVTDCDATAHGVIALFDMMGYNTRIVTNETRDHAEPQIQVVLKDGTKGWIDIGLSEVDTTKALRDYIFVDTTNSGNPWQPLGEYEDK